MTTKQNPWDVLAWIAFGIVVVYFLLKAADFLHSPLSADVAAIISASYFVGRQIMKLDYVYKDVEKLKDDAEKLKSDTAQIKSDFGRHVVESHK